MTAGLACFALAAAALPAAVAAAGDEGLKACLAVARPLPGEPQLLALRSQLDDVAWRDACRQAREADARRRSITTQLLRTGISPTGGFPETERQVARARAATDPDVAELFRRVATDQAAREALSSGGRRAYAAGLSAPAMRLLSALVSADAIAADRSNQAWLDRTVGRRGWFRIGRDGAEADAAAALIVNHGDADPGFQDRMLRIMEPLVAEGETAPRRFAYVYDRWAAAAGRPQRFGHQGSCVGPGQWRPSPIEDPDRVDVRRQAAKLDGRLADVIAASSKACR